MKILIVDKVHPVLCELLTQHHFELRYLPNIPPNEVINEIKEYDGIVIRSKLQLTAEILSKAKKLKFIARLGSGLDNIDTAYAQSKKIACINSPEGNRNAVSEHALGMLLCLFNSICKGNTEVKRGVWNRSANRGLELENKTIGIIGYGNTGSQFAKKLSGFNVTILAYDKYKTDFGNSYVSEVKFDEIFKHTDILSLHIPLSEETTYMVNEEFIERFKKEIYLINTSRGRVVCTKDLVKCLQKKKVLGAMLDVLEYENSNLAELTITDKESFQFLQQSDNVLLTPHVAGWSKESYKKLSEVLVRKIIKRFGNQIPKIRT